MINYLDFKKAKCKNCYKCLKNCPVKAIKIEENQAKIIEERCILCGQCTLVCPQNAKEVHSEKEDIKQLLKEYKVIATVAPSFIANFNIKDFQTLENALKKLGFNKAEETARGAKIVIDEYEKLLKTGQYKNFITSCCPSINNLISLYYPEALKYLAPVDSPVIAHAKIIKEENPDAKIIFIGPCIAKKKECKESGIVDGVLTFEELLELFDENNITLEKIETNQEESKNWNKARFFPISRGIIKSFNNINENYEYIAADGVQRCKEVLNDIENLSNVFLELNACEYSCINGPCSLKQKNGAIMGNAKVRKYVKNNNYSEDNTNPLNIDFKHEHHQFKLENDISPNEDQIKEILAKTGKTKKEDELNCGACGYSTCREKAWAVLNGYADIEMCLPYMREKAENMSYEIIQNSPNGIIVFDSELNITDINSKAASLLGTTINEAKKACILDIWNDATDFVLSLDKKKNIYAKKIKISQTDSYVELSINYIQKHNMLFAIMKDITEKVVSEEKLDKLKLDTIKTTDEVIKKQMRVAQEIASLLGETTAETKVALVNLKKTLKEEGEM